MTPSTEQLAAIESRAPRIVISAGPGSGKTATTVERIRRDIERGANPDDMVAITFTNAAADELKRRLGVRLQYVGTLHGYALAMLPHVAGFAPEVQVLDEDAGRALVEATIDRLKVKATAPEVLALMASPYATLRTQAGIAAVTARKALRELNAATYDTMLAEFQIGLQRGSWGVKWLYVDEYQDSNFIDAEIYAILGSKAELVWCVGDLDQSIYGFRGARPENMVELIDSPKWKHFRLRDNYRSAPQIVHAANFLIRQNGRPGDGVARGPIAEGKVWACRFPDQQAEAAAIALAMSEVGGSRAVLTRYNLHARNLCLALEHLGLKVAVQEWEPEELARLKRWLSLAEYLQAGSPVTLRGLAAHWNPTGLKPHEVGTDKALRILEGIVGKVDSARDIACGELLARLGAPGDELRLFRNVWQGTWEASLEWLRDKAQPKLADPEEIHVGTIHSAKGREWDNVWIAGLEQETIPATKKAEDVPAERRLLYVGMTRARHQLWLTHADSIPKAYGRGMIGAEPSRFLSEISC